MCALETSTVRRPRSDQGFYITGGKNVHVVYLVRYIRFNSIGVHCNSVLHNVFSLTRD